MKKIGTILIAIISLGFTTGLYACECSENRIKKIDSNSYKKNQVVLIGTITSIENDNYKIQVKEILKGKVQQNQIIGIYSLRKELISSCGFFPEYKTDYLLYLTPTQTDNRIYYYASQCEGNRSLDHRQPPYVNNSPKEDLKSWTEEWIKLIKTNCQ